MEENAPEGTAVGTFTLVDPDGANSGSDTGTGTTTGVPYPLEVSSSEGFSGGNFGTSLSISGNLFAVGAPGEGERTKENSGAVYLYQINEDDSVTELMRIESADRKLGDKFGQSVSLQDDLLVVGAPGVDANGTIDTGAIYLYRVADVGVGKKTGLPLSDALNASEDSTSPRTIEDTLQTRFEAGNFKSGGSETYQQADFIYILNGNSADAYYYQEAPEAVGGHGWRKPGEPTVDQKDTVVFDPSATTNPIAIYVKATDVIEVYAPNHHYSLDANSAVGDPAGFILQHLTNQLILPPHTLN